MMNNDADEKCQLCGHWKSQHVMKPLMCADCARENATIAAHIFVPMKQNG